MNVLRALDEHLRTQDRPGKSGGASLVTRANLAALSSVEEILSELVKEASAHEARTDGLLKFAVSRRMQGLVADATAQAQRCCERCANKQLHCLTLVRQFCSSKMQWRVSSLVSLRASLSRYSSLYMHYQKACCGVTLALARTLCTHHCMQQVVRLLASRCCRYQRALRTVMTSAALRLLIVLYVNTVDDDAYRWTH
eukprot:17652-Heterococcus_DN1.PRE.2